MGDSAGMDSAILSSAGEDLATGDRVPDIEKARPKMQPILARIYHVINASARRVLFSPSRCHPV